MEQRCRELLRCLSWDRLKISSGNKKAGVRLKKSPCEEEQQAAAPLSEGCEEGESSATLDPSDEEMAESVDLSPEWIESVLTSYYVFVANMPSVPDIHVVDLSVRKVADGRVVSIFQVDVRHTLGSTEVDNHFVVKRAVEEDFIGLREIKFYTRVIPNLMKKKQFSLLKVPVCYHAKHFPGSGSTLFTENLGYQGYLQLTDRGSLSFAEARTALTYLARQHTDWLNFCSSSRIFFLSTFVPFCIKRKLKYIVIQIHLFICK